LCFPKAGSRDSVLYLKMIYLLNMETIMKQETL